MPASTIATDVRGALKTALAGCTANIYDSVPEAPIVPAIIVIPDSPYMELEILGKATTINGYITQSGLTGTTFVVLQAKT